MKVLYVTCCLNGLIGLRHLVDRDVHIAAVVSIDAGTADRHQVSGFIDVAPFCAAQGLGLITLSNYQLTLNDLKSVSFDAVVVNGWNRLLPADVISAAPCGAIGIHAGHPPIGLGRAPLVWNIILGRIDLEVYVFRLTPRADDGHIMCLSPVEITPQDDVQLLYEKVAYTGARLIFDAIRKLERGDEGLPQIMSFAKHYAKRSPSDGLIDFTASDAEIYNFVRAQSAPYPGAFAYLNGEKWRFDRVVPFDRYAFRQERREPGKIVAVLPSGIVVLTGGAPIWVVAAESDSGNRLPDAIDNLSGLIGLQFSGRMERDGH